MLRANCSGLIIPVQHFLTIIAVKTEHSFQGKAVVYTRTVIRASTLWHEVLLVPLGWLCPLVVSWTCGSKSKETHWQNTLRITRLHTYFADSAAQSGSWSPI